MVAFVGGQGQEGGSQRSKRKHGSDRYIHSLGCTDGFMGIYLHQTLSINYFKHVLLSHQLYLNKALKFSGLNTTTTLLYLVIYRSGIQMTKNINKFGEEREVDNVRIKTDSEVNH